MNTLVRAVIQVPKEGKGSTGVLIALQPPNPKYPQFGYTYQLPGGAVEFNESDRDALQRELKEEFNFEISTTEGDLIPLYTTESERSGNVHKIFLVRKVDDDQFKITDLKENVGIGIYTPEMIIPQCLTLPVINTLRENIYNNPDYSMYVGKSTEGLVIPQEYLQNTGHTPEGVISWETQQSLWNTWEAEARISREGTLDRR